MGKNTGKVREKSGNFVSPEKWEPCLVPTAGGVSMVLPLPILFDKPSGAN